MYMKVGTSSGKGAPNFLDSYGLRHSFMLGEFIRNDLEIKELDKNDKLDFWKKLKEMNYDLETLYAHIESKGDAALINDFKAILRSCILAPTGERQEKQVCCNHRKIARGLDPGDFIIDFNWDTLMSDALLYESPLWFPSTGFGIHGIIPIMHEKSKRDDVASLVQLIHIHGCAALYEETDREDKEKSIVYLGGKTISPMNTLLALTSDPDIKRGEGRQPKLTRQPTEDELRRIDLGWLYFRNRWFSPIFIPPSYYKHEYDSKYYRTVKALIHSLLPSTKQMIVAGYSFPKTDIEHLNSLFVTEILPRDMMLIVVNPENENEMFRDRVRTVFPRIKNIDFSCTDFVSLCRKIDET